MVKFYLEHKSETLLFAFSLFLRIAMLLFLLWLLGLYGDFDGNPSTQFPVLSSDSTNYLINANNILTYGKFSSSLEPPVISDAFRTPGYPLFIAAIIYIFKNPLYISVAQAIFGALTVVILYKIAKIFFSEKISLLASLLFALEPASIFYSSIIFSDTLFTFLLLLSVYLFLIEGKKYKPISGILLGLSALVRPIAQFLPLVFAVFYVLNFYREFDRKRFYELLLFLFGFIIAVAPWLIRNYILFDALSFSSISGINLFFYSILFYSYKNSIPFGEAYALFFSKLKSVTGTAQLESLINSEAAKQIALDYLKLDVLGYIKFHLLKTVPFFITDGLRSVAEWIRLVSDSRPVLLDLVKTGEFRKLYNILGSGDLSSVLFLIGFPIWLAVNIFSLLGAIFGHISGNKKIFLFLLFSLTLILYFALLTGPVANPRYRIPAEPFMFILASYGFMMVWRRYVKKIPVPYE